MARETEGRELDPTLLTAGVTALLKDPSKGLYFVAETTNDPPTIAGQLLITYEWSDWRNGNFWWIQSVYVLEPFRGSGIFKALFQHVQDLCKDREGVCGLRLYVDADNARAQEVYKRMGLRPTEYLLFEKDFVLKAE